MCTDIWKQKKMVVILEVQFHHEQVLSKTINFTISLDWGPVLPFLNIDHDFGNIYFVKRLHFLVQYLGHTLDKYLIFVDWGVLLNEQQLSTFDHFLYFSKPYWTS